MSELFPLRYDGLGTFSVPATRAKFCDGQFTINEVVTFERHEPRSHASHAHYFACIHAAWMRLPEALAGDFLSPEHLRKWALIKSGYCSEAKIACATTNDAIMAAALMLKLDSYALAEATGKVVTIWTAQSQSYRAMGKKKFGESKEAVLNAIAGLIQVSPATLSRQAEAA